MNLVFFLRGNPFFNTIQFLWTALLPDLYNAHFIRAQSLCLSFLHHIFFPFFIGCACLCYIQPRVSLSSEVSYLLRLTFSMSGEISILRRTFSLSGVVPYNYCIQWVVHCHLAAAHFRHHYYLTVITPPPTLPPTPSVTPNRNIPTKPHRSLAHTAAAAAVVVTNKQASTAAADSIATYKGHPLKHWQPPHNCRQAGGSEGVVATSLGEWCALEASEL